MRIFDSQDRFLLVGFLIAAVVVFAQPVRYLLDVAGEIERASGLALLPALVILTVFFVLNLQAKRQEARTGVLRAEAETAQADARAAEMERLLLFGQALGRSLDLEAIREVVARQLPRLAASDETWVLVQTENRWQMLLGASRPQRLEVQDARRMIAEHAIASGADSGTGIVIDGWRCLPLAAGGQTFGVVGLPDRGGAADARHGTLATALTLLAFSIRNAGLFREVRENSLRDGLTGCYNRTHALEVIETELRRARRSQAPTSVIMFDIDHFKRINDRHGHLCGDAVLVEVGKRMRAALRSSDLKCRYGGEEFLVLLPDTPLGGAKHVAESLRRELTDMKVMWKGEHVPVTASLGVSASLPSEIDPQTLIGRADAALYRAKEQGRNCVRLAIEAAVA